MQFRSCFIIHVLSDVDEDEDEDEDEDKDEDDVAGGLSPSLVIFLQSLGYNGQRRQVGLVWLG